MKIWGKIVVNNVKAYRCQKWKTWTRSFGWKTKKTLDGDWNSRISAIYTWIQCRAGSCNLLVCYSLLLLRSYHSIYSEPLPFPNTFLRFPCENVFHDYDGVTLKIFIQSNFESIQSTRSKWRQNKKTFSFKKIKTFKIFSKMFSALHLNTLCCMDLIRKKFLRYKTNILFLNFNQVKESVSSKKINNTVRSLNKAVNKWFSETRI